MINKKLLIALTICPSLFACKGKEVRDFPQYQPTIYNPIKYKGKYYWRIACGVRGYRVSMDYTGPYSFEHDGKQYTKKFKLVSDDECDGVIGVPPKPWYGRILQDAKAIMEYLADLEDQNKILKEQVKLLESQVLKIQKEHGIIIK